MTRIFASLLAAFALGSLSAAKDPPVTKSEAAAAFAKANHVLRTVLQVKVPPAAFPEGAGVASRGLIVKHLGSLLEIVEPKFKFTPPRIKPAPSILSFKDPKVREIAVRLEAMGLIDRFGPLATSKADGLDPSEFGDALGQFLSRVAELTHTPSQKFSPYLQPGFSEPPTGS